MIFQRYDQSVQESINSGGVVKALLVIAVPNIQIPRINAPDLKSR